MSKLKIANRNILEKAWQMFADLAQQANSSVLIR